MHFDSIKSRLVLMTLICVLGMATLIANQHYFTQKLVALNQQRDMLLRLGSDLLQMRRHEKDFLLRHQLDYFNRFNERANEFSNRLADFSISFEDYDNQTGAIGSLAEAMNAYKKGFEEVVTLQNKIGLKEDQGLRGQLTNLAEELSNQTKFVSTSEAQNLLLKTRLSARNFLSTRDLQYRNTFFEHANELSQTLSRDSNTGWQPLLVRYESTFDELSQLLATMGLTHNEGLRGQFRRQAHDVENQLNKIDKVLQPVIEKQERTVQTYSLLIAGLTSVVLVLLLVKSFATFHRAFSNFVMFFYRCKRQYQKIDPKKLGFTEFKSLAELANEMVESRRVIESRLAKAEAKLEQLQHSGDANSAAK